MKKIKLKIYSVVALALSATVSFAQPANQFFLESLPQSFYLNPGKKQQSSFHFDFWLPMNVGVVNNGFTFSDLMDGNTITPANILPELKDNNFLSVNVTKHLFNLGFKKGDANYFSYNASFKFMADMNFSKDFFSVLIDGNGTDAALSGGPLNLDGTRLNLTAYIEHGFGYSRVVNEKLIIGGRLKYLQGVFNVSGNLDGISLDTDPNLASLTVQSSLALQTSIPDSAMMANQEFLGSGNNGFGIDLGGSYVINDQITTYASIIDLGVLTWGADRSQTLSNNGAAFTFEGLKLADLSDTSAINGLGDSISDIFKLEETPGKYTTNLPTRFFVGGSYKFDDQFSADLAYSGKFVNGQYLSTAIVGGGWAPSKWFEAKLSYTIADNTYTNVGLGAVLSLGAWQWYFVTDNIIGLTRLDYAKVVNASLGMTFAFGRKKYFEKFRGTAAKKKKGGDKKDKKKTDAKATPDAKKKEAKKVPAEGNATPAVDSTKAKEAVTPVVEEVKEKATETVKDAKEAVKETVTTPATQPTSTDSSSVAPVAQPAASDSSATPVVEPVVAPADSSVAPVAAPSDSSAVAPVKAVKEAVSDVNKKVEEVKQSAEEKAKEVPADIKKEVPVVTPVK